MKKPRILIVGDLIIDIHNYGEPVGISSEAPIIVNRHEKQVISHGGAALVARNVIACGGEAIFISSIGNDGYREIAKTIIEQGVDARFVQSKRAITTVKERFIVRNQKVFRWDRINNIETNTQEEREIEKVLKNELKKCTNVVISDYHHGMITRNLAMRIMNMAKKEKKKVFIDSQVSRDQVNYDWYKGADVICFNSAEAVAYDGDFFKRKIEVSLRLVQKKLKAGIIVVKRGREGVIAIINSKVVSVSGYSVEAIDPVGAGDAFLAMLVQSEVINEDALKKSNIWAALSTTVAGTAPPSLVMFNKIIKSKKYLPFG